tara:strand:- start:1482 stop:1646 length:165 start_codon:yes stop_codon:yes gene_type:complete
MTFVLDKVILDMCVHFRADNYPLKVIFFLMPKISQLFAVKYVNCLYKRPNKDLF